MSDRVTSIIELFGVACIAVGVGLFSIPAALIVVGLIAIVVGVVG